MIGALRESAVMPPSNLPPEARPPLQAKRMAWVVVQRQGAFVCHQTGIPGFARIPDAVLMLPAGVKSARIISGCVNAELGLGLLLEADDGTLLYGSTRRGHIKPLLEIFGRFVKRADQPALVPAGSMGTAPWVYVRSLHPMRNAIKFEKLDPVGEVAPGAGRHVPHVDDHDH
jgi:hypothetical protein